MRLYRGVVGCLLSVLAACTTTPVPSADVGTTYTCCDAADIDRDYEPGQALTIQWIVVPGRAGADTSTSQPELNARLTGPYPTADELKTAADNLTGASTFTAAPVRPSGQAGERPMSVIPIPPTATPGYYNLVTSVGDLGGTTRGASIIQVVPKT